MKASTKKDLLFQLEKKKLFLLTQKRRKSEDANATFRFTVVALSVVPTRHIITIDRKLNYSFFTIQICKCKVEKYNL